MGQQCAVAACDQPYHAKDMCKAHYLRTRRYGTPTPVTARLDPVGYFWARVDKKPAGCWLWTGSTGHGGYGQLPPRGITPSRTSLAHRVAWELTRGPIPDGLHMDHLCRVPRCVNPAHLEPVTVAENVRRGLHGVLRTHCRRGHELTPANTYVKPSDRSRKCRTCAREDKRRRDAAKRAERAGGAS